MSNASYKIFPLGDSALTVEFGNVVSPQLNQRAIALANRIENNPFSGLVEIVPAYATTTIFYDLVAVRHSFTDFPSAYEAVKRFASNLVEDLDVSTVEDSQAIEMPVIFDRTCEFDLAHVANDHGISIDQVIDIFTSTTYRVYMLGFLPGFSYMGEVDERIATPRKTTPRTVVPKGSIGIAGRQTGIYSLASPGGWQIIGKTEIELFTPNVESPTFLKAGDRVQFVEQQKSY